MKVNILLFFSILLFCASSYGIKCESFTQSSVRKIRINTAHYELVQQCHGTCYLEVAVSALENTLSLSYGREVSIDRSALFYELILARLESWRSFLGPAEYSTFNQWMVRRGEKDFVDFLLSGGVPMEILDIALNKGLIVYEGRTPLRKNIDYAYLVATLIEFRAVLAKYKNQKIDLLEFIEEVNLDAGLYIKGRINSLRRDPHGEELDQGMGDRNPRRVILSGKFSLLFTPTPFLWHRRVIDALGSGKGLILEAKSEYFKEFIPEFFPDMKSLSLYEAILGPGRDDVWHGVFVVGVDLNMKGTKVLNLIVRNSWGSMDREFVIPANAFIRRKHRLREYQWILPNAPADFIEGL